MLHHNRAALAPRYWQAERIRDRDAEVLQAEGEWSYLDYFKGVAAALTAITVAMNTLLPRQIVTNTYTYKDSIIHNHYGPGGAAQGILSPIKLPDFNLPVPIASHAQPTIP